MNEGAEELRVAARRFSQYAQRQQQEQKKRQVFKIYSLCAFAIPGRYSWEIHKFHCTKSIYMSHI
jgi:hypothetical protein